MNGKQKSVRDMVLSLGLIGIVAGFIYVFIPTRRLGAPLSSGSTTAWSSSRHAARPPIRWRRPRACPSEWKATSVRFQGDDFDAWHLGFHDPDGEYVAIEQSTQKPPTFIDDASQGAEETKHDAAHRRAHLERYEGGRSTTLSSSRRRAPRRS